MSLDIGWIFLLDLTCIVQFKFNSLVVLQVASVAFVCIALQAWSSWAIWRIDRQALSRPSLRETTGQIQVRIPSVLEPETKIG